MAGTGRAVVVTIHQPRSEIFHAFDKILLLCKGQVAFFGSPVKVWEFFRKALIMEKELEVRMPRIMANALTLDLLMSIYTCTSYAYIAKLYPNNLQLSVSYKLIVYA